MLGLGDFIANPSYKIPKKPKANTITIGQIRKKAKKGNKSQQVKRAVGRNSQQVEQWQEVNSDKIGSQVAKISQSYRISTAPLFLLLSAPFSSGF